MSELHLVLNKIITTLEETTQGTTIIGEYKHRDLKRLLAGRSEVQVSYSFGMQKRRVKQLEQAGFKWSKDIWNEPQSKCSIIKQVWVKD
jgi:hypothetical protein